MNGLCHKCLRSNVEVFPISGKTLCKDCKETHNSKSSSTS